MKHVHYDKVMAKAVNMDLVVFIKLGEEWCYATMPNSKLLSFSEDYDYFLCLPQHKEACLHWLNGGEVEENYNSRWDKVEQHSWNDQSVFNFDDGYIIRIKPKKEKRWIGVNVTTGKTTSAYTHDDEGNYAEDEVRLTKGNLSDWQFIEIEVEV